MTGKLRKMCTEKLQQQYGENPPDWAADRFDEELALIAAKNNQEKFLQVAEFAQKDLAEGHLNWACGTVADSFVAYLLGITECNPLPAHYLCTECHYTELAEHIEFWPDLPEKRCPQCGKPMKKGGFHLPYECFLGCPGQEKDLHFEIRVAYAELEDKPFRDYGPAHAVPTDFVRQLSRLGKETGVCLEDIPQNDDMVLRLMHSDIFHKLHWREARKVLELMEPSTFSDLEWVCDFTSSTGTLEEMVWAHMIPEAARQKRAVWREVIVCREEVFAYLSQKGMSQADAIWYTDCVYQGKFYGGMPNQQRQQLLSHGVPEWYICLMEKIRYLFPKAHTIGYLLMLYRLAWYEHHYPEAYARVMNAANK